MKKTLAIVIAVLALSLCTFAGDNNNTFKEHGTMKTGIEPGCWEFVADDGKSYQPVGGPASMYREGLTGVLTAHPENGTYSYCQNGPIVEVRKFEADRTITVVGTLSYDANEVSWILTSGNNVYHPLSISKSFYQVGAQVKVSGILRTELESAFNGGKVLEVLDYETIGEGRENNSEGDKAAFCQSEFAHCTTFCSQSNCFVSCETIYGACKASN